MKVTHLALALVAASVGLGAAARADVVYESSFGDPAIVESITLTQAGFDSSVASIRKSQSRSAPTALLLGGIGGGPAPSHAHFAWDLGGSHDFYQGGEGEVTVFVQRQSAAAWVEVQLRHGQEVRATQRHNFTDHARWHEVEVGLDGDEVDIDNVLFTVHRASGTAATYVWIDDFRAQGPAAAAEPQGRAWSDR